MSEKTDENKTNILMLVFSATGNTMKIAEAIEKRLQKCGASITLKDITSHASRKEEREFDGYDGVIFGFPIYSKRAPCVCREWLAGIEGKGMRCAMFFTYGGFGKDPAHYYTKKLLERQGFIVVSSAEFLGAHSFNRSGWGALVGRPDESDLRVAEEYAKKTLKRLSGEDPDVLGDPEKPSVSEEELDAGSGGRFKLITKLPTRDKKKCSMCRLCETLCPTGAMDATKGSADQEKCILCFRCITICPDKVLHTNDLSDDWDKRKDLGEVSCEKMDAQKSKIFL